MFCDEINILIFLNTEVFRHGIIKLKGRENMKFSNGFWLDKQGCLVSRPQEVRSYHFDGQTLTLYAPHRFIETRGDSLNLTMSTIEISLVGDEIFHITHTHHAGKIRKGANFHVNHQKQPIEFRDEENCLKLLSKHMLLLVTKKPFSITYYYDGKLKTTSPFKAMAWIEDENHKHYMREQLTLGINETIYGLGERFTPFVKNGQVVEMWNADGGTCSQQAYKNIPFYISSNSYGIFVNHSEDVSFEIASEVVNRVSFTTEGESLNYYFIGGSNPKEVLERYTFLTGRPPLVPSYSFGLWLSTSFTTDYNEATINHFIDGMQERNIPLSVFHFDCFWMKESEWCNFTWDEDMFTNPEVMLQDLKAKGLHICVWINPYIAQKSPLFKEAMANGYLIHNEDGSVFQTDLWQAGMGIVDFTNPDAKAWYTSHLQRLIDMGVDCFKTDFGERIPCHVKYYDHSDPIKMHNYYTYLYNETVYQLLEQNFGKDQACLFARSATTGCQMFPVHWGGDCSSNYDSMAETLRGGLSLGLAGFGYWSHDISGFEQSGTPDLYKRWVAFGLLSSHSRLHGSSSYRVPWLFDEEASEVLAHFTRLKASLMPYLLHTSNQAHLHGTPMLRAMFLEFPSDMQCRYLDTQYMLGDNLLVAPIFNDQSLAHYYLPKGKWTHLLSGKVKEGGQWYEGVYDYFSLPLFVKENSLILRTEDKAHFDDDYATLTLHAYFPSSELTTQYQGHTITLTKDRQLITDLENVKLVIHE